MNHNPKLTSSELASLWSSYISDSMNICIMKHFLANVDDEQIKEIVHHSKELSTGHIESLISIFNKENLPLPIGYTDADVNEQAPRLFSDIFYLRFLQFMGRTGTNINGMALGITYREDVRAFYKSTVNESAELYDNIIRLMTKKGILVRSPYIPYYQQVEFIQDDHFLEGYLTLHKRPLLAIEIAHLSNIIEANVIGRTLVDGLTQVAEAKEVKKHLQEGFELGSQIIKAIEQILEENHTNTPFSSDSTITNSTITTFSDKLIMGILSALTTVSIGSIGQGIGASMRSDIIGEYTKLLAKIGKFAMKSGKISIKNGWIEKPPQTIDREKLQKGN
ncbi:DUF3231 family protein [Bacillus salitolerans]|uniref:DUF3231 family protein n=1 Tax=Bacillus salitolerans TaxID=1437434 RepID=A0ABW4LVZ4_9BACI